MDHTDIILDMLGTIRRLEKAHLLEPDPRLRMEIAETLDILNKSFDYEVDRFAQALKKKTAA